MDDGDRLPPTFDEWERIANDQIGTFAAKGIEIKQVNFSPYLYRARNLVERFDPTPLSPQS
jgi:hypothetical protein